MRRQFNRSILPKEPPKKGKNYKKHIGGSPFNKWFREAIDKTGLTIDEFATFSKIPDGSIRRWRKLGDPRKHNQLKLARELTRLGLDTYDNISSTILRLCDDERPVRKN